MREVLRTDRRHPRTGLLGLAAVLSLTACSGTGDEQTAPSSPAPTATSNGGASSAPPMTEESGEALPAAVDPALFPDANLLGRVGWRLAATAPTEGTRPAFGWPCEAGTDADDFSAPDAAGHQTWPVSGFSSGVNDGGPGAVGFDVLDYPGNDTAGQALDDYIAALGACDTPYPDGGVVDVTGPSDLADPGRPQHYDTAYAVEVTGPAPQGVIVGRLANRLVLSVYATDPGEQLEGLDIPYLTQSLATSVLDTVLSNSADSEGDTDAAPFPDSTDPDVSETIIGTNYPEFTGIEEYVEDAPLAVADTQTIVEEVFNGTFEGTTVSYVGTTSEAPFHVYPLTEPTRLVVEVEVQT